MSNNIKTYTAELFIKEKHTLGESPFYDVRTKTLSWVDITKENFLLLDRMETNELFLTGRQLALRFRQKSQALI